MTSQKWTNLPQFCKEKHCHYFDRKTSTCVEASSGVADPTLFKLRSSLLGWRHNWRITFFKRARRGFLLKFSFQKKKKWSFIIICEDLLKYDLLNRCQDIWHLLLCS